MGERPGRPEASIRGFVSLAAWAALVSCVSYDVTLAEFDSVSRIADDETWPTAADYRADPERYSWMVRRLLSSGLSGLIPKALKVKPKPSVQENPTGFARESFLWLADSTDGDLRRIGQVSARLLWVAELDTEQPYNQAIAVRGVGRMMAELEFDPLQMRLPDPTITTEDRVSGWLETLNEGWPDKRKGAPLPEAKRGPYIAALDAITELPLPTASPTSQREVGAEDQRAIIRALNQGLLLERDPELIEPTRRALLRALFHGLSMGLHRALYDPSARVREAAIESIHSLGGGESVPFLLALIARRSGVDPSSRYDEDRFVRLTLVRLCGQLGPNLAMKSYGNGPTAVELLYETFFSDPELGTRKIALQALAQCLGRPIDFDGEWAETWWRDDYVPNRKSVSDR